MRYVEENEINIYFLFIYVIRDFADVEPLTCWLWNFLYHNEEMTNFLYHDEEMTKQALKFLIS